MRNITKRFPGVTALDSVSLAVKAGEVHLLLGENGAGKSTLMKILSGAYPLDSGSISLDGAPVRIRSPLHARELGISMIYQEMNLVPHLTVAENIFLGAEPARFGFLDRRAMRREAGALLRRLHAGINPDSPVADLTIARQQLVEIAKALSARARIVIMDEPTAPLTQREVSDLFRIIRSLKASGVAVIYISHRLEEARQIGDRVTVLRDGRVAGLSTLKAVSDGALVRLMVGRELSRRFPRLASPGKAELLSVEGLARKGSFGPVSFSVRGGEILGFAGLIGSGRTEVARCLIGADPATRGSVRLDGHSGRFASPRQSKKAGMVLLPEDRKAQGLVLGLPVLNNITMASLERFTRFGFIRSRKERRTASGLMRRLRIQPPALDRAAQFLSGGNQQKLVLAKWLAVRPRVIIFDEPTRGVDVGAKFEVYRLIASLASRGAAILLISSDLGEVLGMSHRVAVMRDGRMTSIFPRRLATPERVMHAAMGLARR